MIPSSLTKELEEYYPNDYNDIINSYNQQRHTTLRVNTIKATPEEIASVLKSNNISFKKVLWSDTAFILSDCGEEKVTKLPIYEEGKIYLQSLSSQLPPLFVEPNSNDLILDMTAAPGGKTTEMAALSNNQAMITAIEKNKIRSDRLKYNIEKQGAKKVSILNTDATHIDEYFTFNKILLDAPCSGSGTLTNDNHHFDIDFVKRITEIQKKLMSEAIKHLSPNGYLIYSTCSILKEENEDIINYILSKNPNLELIPIDLTKYQDIPKLPTTIPGTMCVKPTAYYEGFFVAKIKKIK